MAVCCHRGLCQWIEILQCRCGKQSSEEAPSLLLSTDNFNIWPRIVFLQLVLWKRPMLFPSNRFTYLCLHDSASKLLKKKIYGVQVFVAASAWLMSISYHRSAYLCYAKSFKMAAGSFRQIESLELRLAGRRKSSELQTRCIFAVLRPSQASLKLWFPVVSCFSSQNQVITTESSDTQMAS